MTSTTPIDGLAAHLRGTADALRQAFADSAADQYCSWASAVESLALERTRVQRIEMTDAQRAALTVSGPVSIPGAAPQAVPARAEITDAEIDRFTAEAMVSVPDPLQWGRLGDGSGNMLRQFGRSLARAILSARKDRADDDVQAVSQEYSASLYGGTADALIAMSKEVARLRKEVRRLDWLDSDDCKSITKVSQFWHCRTPTASLGQFQSIRAAIDAAMKGEAP